MKSGLKKSLFFVIATKTQINYQENGWLRLEKKSVKISKVFTLM